MKKIIVTGGSGRFGKILKKYKSKYTVFFPTKSKLNIKKYKSIDKYIKKIKPDYFIHCAAISRPMKIHEKNISQSISTNIIGTSNVVMACKRYNTKLKSEAKKTTVAKAKPKKKKDSSVGKTYANYGRFGY